MTSDEIRKTAIECGAAELLSYASTSDGNTTAILFTSRELEAYTKKVEEKIAAETEVLRAAIVAMAEDGWLYHGVEGMSESQEKCYRAYLVVNLPKVPE